MDGWMDVWEDGSMDRCMERWMDGWMYVRLSSWVYGWWTTLVGFEHRTFFFWREVPTKGSRQGLDRSPSHQPWGIHL
jgi:hypothetical protein